MCLAVPGKIVKIQNNIATVDYGKKVIREADVSLIECKIGDFVIIQAGFAVEVVEKQRAKALHDILNKN